MLRLESISKTFETTLFQDLSLSLRYGEGVLLMGSNGSGKSTLLRIVSGLVSADSGQVLLDGSLASRQRGRFTLCGSSSSAGFYERLSLRQNLHYFGSLYGLSPKQVDTVLQSNAIFKIDYWDLPVEKLSDGMKQKAKLVRAFLHDPDIALLDEPLNFLDSQAQQALLTWIRNWVTQKPNRLYLFTQHSGSYSEKTFKLEGRRAVLQC